MMGITNKLSGSSWKACLFAVLALSTTNCTTDHQKQEDAPKSSEGAAAKTYVIATIAKGDRPAVTIAGHAGNPAAPGEAVSFEPIFSNSGRGVVCLIKEGGKVSVVHNQGRGKPYAAISSVVVSSDGRRTAYAALVDGKWRMVVDGSEGRAFDMLLPPLFSPDSQHVAYQGKEGDKWYLVIDGTANGGTTATYASPDFSSDSTLLAYVETAASNSEMKLVLTDLAFRKQVVKQGIGDLLFTTDAGKTRIAAEEVVGNKVRIIDFTFARPDVVHAGPLYDVIEKLAVGDDGSSVAYCALKGGKRLLVLNDREAPLPRGLLPELPVVRPDGKGVGLLLGFQKKVSLHEPFSPAKDKATTYDEAAGLVYSKDGRYHAYAARRGEKWFVVVNGKEGPPLDKVVTPQFSPDSSRLVYRARQDGRRFVVVADTTGRTINEHPAYEQVFDVRFTADGKSVAYGVKDGNQLVWKVERL